MTITVFPDGSVTVVGDEAKNYNAIRLDSFEVANKGILAEANEGNGFVRWIGQGSDATTATLGPNSIKIVKKPPRGR